MVQIAVGLERLVTLTRVTVGNSDGRRSAKHDRTCRDEDVRSSGYSRDPQLPTSEHSTRQLLDDPGPSEMRGASEHGSMRQDCE